MTEQNLVITHEGTDAWILTAKFPGGATFFSDTSLDDPETPLSIVSHAPDGTPLATRYPGVGGRDFWLEVGSGRAGVAIWRTGEGEEDWMHQQFAGCQIMPTNDAVTVGFADKLYPVAFDPQYGLKRFCRIGNGPILEVSDGGDLWPHEGMRVATFSQTGSSFYNGPALNGDLRYIAVYRERDASAVAYYNAHSPGNAYDGSTPYFLLHGAIADPLTIQPGCIQPFPWDDPHPCLDDLDQPLFSDELA